MKIISAAELAKAAPYRDIVEALRQGFREDIVTPVRHQHQTSDVAILLLMPAWSKDFTGLKTVVFKSDNPKQGLPTITASYLLIDNRTGATVAMMDGTELTRRRTAGCSRLTRGKGRSTARTRKRTMSTTARTEISGDPSEVAGKPPARSGDVAPESAPAWPRSRPARSGSDARLLRAGSGGGDSRQRAHVDHALRSHRTAAPAQRVEQGL